MVSDIAAVYGQTCNLGLRATGVPPVQTGVGTAWRGDVAVRVGERVVLQAASSKALAALAQALGVHFSTKLLKQSGARLVPLIGAIGVVLHRDADTLQVANNARALSNSASAHADRAP